MKLAFATLSLITLIVSSLLTGSVMFDVINGEINQFVIAYIVASGFCFPMFLMFTIWFLVKGNNYENE